MQNNIKLILKKNKNFYKDFKKFFKKLKKDYFKKDLLKLHEPVFSKISENIVKNCIDSTFVSPNGKYNKLFEKKIKDLTKSKYLVSLNSGTSALFVSLKSIGIKKDDEVLLPSLTFVSTANSILYNQGVPHFLDVSQETLGIDPLFLEGYLKKISMRKNNKLFNKKTKRQIKALICVHVFGNSSKILDIKKICKKYKIILIEDAAEALNSFYKKKHLGTFGKVGILSFNGNKIITSGSGGIILTNDKKIFNFCNHVSSNSKINHKWEYLHDGIGYNLKMPNLNAALAYSQLLDLKKIQENKNKLFKIYKKFFKKYESDIELVEPIKSSISNNWLISIKLKNRFINKKNEILNFLLKNRVHARPTWKPLHTLKYLDKFPRSNLANTNALYKKVISLPSGSK